VRAVNKVSEGSPHVADLIAAGEVALVVNTPRGGHGARTDGSEIRAAAVRAGIPCITTIEAAEAAAAALGAARPARPRALQDDGAVEPGARAFRPVLRTPSAST
jgi:carbamoyl-phosphate synthase large subunit